MRRPTRRALGHRRSLIALAGGIALMLLPAEIHGQSAPPDGGIDPDQVTIRWPSAEHATLEAAVAALPDAGGIVDIAPGVHTIEAPVTIGGGGHVVLQGAGCGDELPRGGRAGARNRPFTHLQGRDPSPAVPPLDESDGLVVVRDDTAVVVRNLKLSGFDASIVHKPAAIAGDPPPNGDPEPAGSALTIQGVCMLGTARGIVSLVPGHVTVQQVLIRDVSWNGISVSHPQPPKFGHLFDAFDIIVLRAMNACIVIKNAHASFDSLECTGVGGDQGSGVYVENSVVTIRQVGVGLSSRPGIVVNGGVTSITKGTVFGVTGLGVLFFEPVSAHVNDMSIEAIASFSSGPLAGRFGDGFVVAGRALGTSSSFGHVTLLDARIRNTTRAGVSSFGAPVSLGNTRIACNAFEVAGETFDGHRFSFEDLGGNRCGCPDATGPCAVVSPGIEAPEPVQVAD